MRVRLGLGVCLVLSALGVLEVSTAGAQAPAPSRPATATDPSRDQEARGLFDAGRTSFDAGRYTDALGYFQRAHELSGRPALLFNIATTHDRLRHDAEALGAFEAYLSSVPDAQNRAEVEARIAPLREAVATRERERVATERAARETGPAVGPEPAHDGVAPRASAPRVLTWIAGGLALATAGVAAWAWISANSRYGDLEDGCYAMRGACTEAEIDASGVATRVTLTNVFGLAAFVAAAGAVTLFFLEAPDDSTPDAPHAALGVGPAGVVLRGAF